MARTVRGSYFATCAFACTSPLAAARTACCSITRTRWPTSTASIDDPAKRASEQLMQGYYRNAKATPCSTPSAAEHGRSTGAGKRANAASRSTTTSSRSATCSTSAMKPFDRQPAMIFDSLPGHAGKPRVARHDRQNTARTVAGARMITPEFRANPTIVPLFSSCFRALERRGA
jgi:hypothetical protein